MKIFRLLILTSLLTPATIMLGQNQYTLASDHKITIEGTSNVHNWEEVAQTATGDGLVPVSYTHLRAHETVLDLVCRLLLEKKKKT